MCKRPVTRCIRGLQYAFFVGADMGTAYYIDSYVHGEVIFYLRPVGAKNLEK